MLKKIILTTFLTVPLFAMAQLTVNIQLPAGGMVHRDQLWNLVIVNNQQPADVLLTLDLQDAVSRQTVLSAVGRVFSVGKGIKVITIKDVQPVQYNYLSADMNGQFIPLGSYIACYRVFKNDIKNPEPLGDECVPVDISPLGPPLLNTPGDRDTLDNSRPQFSWMPPAPVDMFSDLRYDILITEMLPGQTAKDAVLLNTPVFTGHDIKGTFLQYPSAYAAFMEGKSYAWQVVARNRINYAAQTEVWSFTIRRTEKPQALISQAGYISLSSSTEASGISYITGGELKVKYYSYDRSRTATIKLLTAGGSLIKEIQQKIEYGNNYFAVPVGRVCSAGTVYKIEITDEAGNKYSAGFIIQ